jgi:hypothetical protein
MDRDKMSNFYREPSIDASYQVSVHLAKLFHRRRFLEIDQITIWPMKPNLVGSIDGKFSALIAHFVPIR